MAKHKSSAPASASRLSSVGPKQRQLRVGELLRRTLSEVLQRGEVHDADLQGMSITVGEVRISPDLRIATAYVLPLGGKGQEVALEALRRNKHEIRHLVVKGMTLKFAPDLRFEIDDTFDRMDKTTALFADKHVRQDLDD
jgi:ribosome-binding factor A